MRKFEICLPESMFNELHCSPTKFLETSPGRMGASGWRRGATKDAGVEICTDEYSLIFRSLAYSLLINAMGESGEKVCSVAGDARALDH